MNKILFVIVGSIGLGLSPASGESLEDLAVREGDRWDRAQVAAPAPEDSPEATVIAAPIDRPRHAHYALGRHETDRDNQVGKASLIRGAGVSGHLINALPPAALAGTLGWWGHSLSGKYGEHNRSLTVMATALVPLGIIMIATMTVYVMVDNAVDAVSDAFAPGGRWGIKG